MGPDEVAGDRADPGEAPARNSRNSENELEHTVCSDDTAAVGSRRSGHNSYNDYLVESHSRNRHEWMKMGYTLSYFNTQGDGTTNEDVSW